MTSRGSIVRAATTILTLTFAAAANAQSVPHFTAPQTYVSNGAADGPSSFWSATGDFNGDGLIDLAAPDVRGINNIGGFSVAYGQPGGGFGAPVPTSVGTFVRAVRAADFNHDGRTDLLLVTFTEAVVVQGNADDTFGSLTRLFVRLAPNDAALADFNGDGNTDVVVPGDLGYSVSLGNGDGTFRPATLLQETAPTFWAITGDFNNDGVTDFTGAGGIFGHTYFGNADGTFQAPIDASLAAPSGSISGDFNGDGNIDIAMLSATARQDGSNFGFKVAMGFGDGTFFNGAFGVVFGNKAVSNLAAGDFNGDGVTDIATFDVNSGRLQVVAGSNGFFGGTFFSVPAAGNGVLLAADVDGNGSNDLVLSNTRDFAVFRSTHGNPPLVARITTTPAFVLGGSSATVRVELGNAAPAGAVVTLTSDSPLVSFPGGATVAIPEGAASASITVATAAVDAAATATLTAEWNGVSQSAQLGVVPAYTLSGFSIAPATQYGIFTSTGTLTLSDRADASATVLLSSNNPAAASVPASVTVPAGATTVTFPITLAAVTANTAVTITASRGGVTLESSVTVLKAADSVAISKAILTRKTSELKIEASSTSETTTLTAYNAATGALLGTLENAGSGRFKGTVIFVAPANGPAPAVVLKSALGGSASATVQVK